ncbi:MAG: universal stress protein [Chloroflexota bacterium]
MFKKILLALDGSEFSERAIGPALEIATKFGAEIVLLRVITVEEDAPISVGLSLRQQEIRPDYTRRYREEAEGYLHGIKTRRLGSGVEVRIQAALGEPAEVIVATARAEGADLIVMSTHGRSGLTRLLYGSVAEAVLRGANVPLLLIPIKEKAKSK